MLESSFNLRRLDHLVMPVASLAGARDFFATLGFTVAPDAVHPFGTANACVFFADGTYLEPLAIGDPRAYAASGQGVFVGRDQAFRKRRGEPGFSGVAFQSQDIAADHAALASAGLADGEIFQFSRAFVNEGIESTLTFKLAFASERRVPDLFFFAVQAVVPTGDRSVLTKHANGVSGIARLVMSSLEPDLSAALLQEVTGTAQAVTTAHGLSFRMANGTIEVLDGAGMYENYGRGRDAARGLRLEGIVLHCADLDTVRDMAGKAGLGVGQIDDRLLIDLIDSPKGFIAIEQG